MFPLSLEQLGLRIAIIGPSNSGKSTLADAMARKTGGAILHLDQIAHIPGTKWVRRPEDAFIAAHDSFIEKESWVIEGNYSACMPQRFARATSVVWIDPPLGGCIARYLKRSFFESSEKRRGSMHDAQGEFSMALIKYTLTGYPLKRPQYQNLLDKAGLPVLHLISMRILNDCYAAWDLPCPG